MKMNGSVEGKDRKEKSERSGKRDGDGSPAANPTELFRNSDLRIILGHKIIWVRNYDK